MVWNRRRMLGGLAALWGGMMLPSLPAVAQDSGGEPMRLVVRQRFRRDWIDQVAWSPDGSRLAVGWRNRTGGDYGIWDTRSWEMVRQLGGKTAEFWADNSWEMPLRFTPDGRHLIIPSHGNPMPDGNGRVCFGLWNVKTGAIDRLVRFPYQYFGNKEGNGAPTFMPIPSTARAAISFGQINPAETPIVLYDTESWESLRVLCKGPPQGGWSAALDLSPDGRLLALAGGRIGQFDGTPKGRIWFYDVGNGEMVRLIDKAHKDTIDHVVFSPDGRFVATAPDAGVHESRNGTTDQMENMADADPVRVWDVATGTKVAGLHTDVPSGVHHMAFDPSGRWLMASIGGGWVVNRLSEFRVWDWQSGTLAARRYVEGGRYAGGGHLAFSPDGRLVAMVSQIGVGWWGAGGWWKLRNYSRFEQK